MNQGLFDIQRIAAATGLEESLVRFYERAFAEILPGKTQVGDRACYPEEAVRLFQLFHQQIQVERLSISEVKRRSRQEVAPSRIALKYARVIVVASGKGGVGKTNVSVNLAVEFERLGRKTIVFDADFGLANVHLLAGVSPRKSLVLVAEGRASIGETIAEGPEHIGIVAGGSGVLALADLTIQQRERLIEGLHDLERCADVVIVDAAPGISANVLDFIRASDELVLVCTPDLLSITDAYGLLKAMSLKRIDVQVRVLVNQVRSAAEAADVCARLEACVSRFLNIEIDILGYVFRDPSVPAAAQSRAPVTVVYPKSKASRCFARIAAQLDDSEKSARKTTSTFAKYLQLYRDEAKTSSLEPETVR